MQIFFICLAGLTSILFACALFFSSISPDRLYHLYFGLIATISCLITHVWVFFYFIGTGEGIREGIREHRLDTAPIKVTKKFKGRIFPFAFFAMVLVIVAAIKGGALRVGQITKTTHILWFVIAILFNAWTFRKEYRTIGENEKLMRELNAEIPPNPP